MKLLFCLKCNDIFNLSHVGKTCQCGQSGGRYLDNINAEYWGDQVVPLGFENNSLKEAIIRQTNNPPGTEFTAFVIPKQASSMIKQYKHL